MFDILKPVIHKIVKDRFKRTKPLLYTELAHLDKKMPLWKFILLSYALNVKVAF